MTSLARRRAVLGGLALAVAVHLVVLYAPSAPGDPVFSGSDKVVHVLVFLVPTLLALLAGVRPALALGAFGAHAVLSEVLQWQLLPGRSGDPWDAVADLAGVAFAWLLWRRPRRPAR